MSIDKTLKELRELNSGCNPEIVEIDYIASIDSERLILEDGMLFYKTECVSEIEYILNYKGIYGVVYNGSYYRQV